MSAIEYRWAENQLDRLPALAADLVRRQVAVIVTTGRHRSGARGQGGDHDDPDRLRHRRRPGQSSVLSPASPAGRQLDRRQFFRINELEAKRLELLRRAGARRCSRCRARQSGQRAEYRGTLRKWRRRLAPSGCKSRFLTPAPTREIDAAFATIVQKRPDALFVGANAFFTSRRVQLVPLAARHADPRDLPARTCRSRRADELRIRHCRMRVVSRRLHRPHPQGRQARRPAGRCSRRSSSSSSISRRPRRSASKSRRRCSPAPTR